MDRCSETSVVAVNTVPLPSAAVFHPVNTQPVTLGAVGKVPTVVAGQTTFLVCGNADAAGPFALKVTVNVPLQRA